MQLLTDHGPYLRTFAGLDKGKLHLVSTVSLDHLENMVYACTLVSSEIEEVRVRLGEKDIAAILRTPDRLELLASWRTLHRVQNSKNTRYEKNHDRAL